MTRKLKLTGIDTAPECTNLPIAIYCNYNLPQFLKITSII